MAVDARGAFRQPNMTDMVGLHHAMLLFRARESRANRTNETWSVAAESRVYDLEEAKRSPPSERFRYLALFEDGTAREWNQKIGFMSPRPSSLPHVLCLQDSLNPKNGSTPEMDCVREQWQMRLLPEPSSAEDPA